MITCDLGAYNSVFHKGFPEIHRPFKVVRSHVFQIYKGYGVKHCRGFLVPNPNSPGTPHFFVKGISHVLKVRIIADLEDRVRLEMEREGISRDEAMHVLLKDDEERVKWSKALYGIDTRKASLYDLVLHIHKLTVNDAVEIICHTAGLKHFQTTPDSQRAIDDLALAARVKAALVDVKPDLQVSAQDGTVSVKTEAPIIHEAPLVQRIQEISNAVTGVKETRVNVIPSDAE